MEEIIAFVKKVVPSVDDKELQNAFNEVGVDHLDDLQDVNFENDAQFKNVLKLVQARKVQRAVYEKFNTASTSCTTPTTQTTTTPTSIHTPSTSTTSTPSVPSPVNSTNQNLSTPSTSLSEFAIPTDKFSTQLKNKMERKIKATASEENEVASIIAKEIHCINTHPGTQFLARVAINLVNLYPATFAVHHCDDNTIVGHGHDLIYRKLKEKMKNLNRTKKRQLFCDDDDESGAAPSQKRLSNTQKEKYGTLNFLPMELPEDETFSSQKEKKTWLKEEFLKSDRERDNEKIIHYMAITYTSQRVDVTDKTVTTNVLRSEWPFLFEVSSQMSQFY